MAMVQPQVVVPMRRRHERRAAERFEMELPMTLERLGEGTTRDLSVSGLSFTLPRPCEVGARVDVTIEYLLDGHNFPLRCNATVVRCEPFGSAYTIGARLATAFLD
jgi:hypothetical protein